MRQWHMKPNTITYYAAISACEKGQQWITATTLLREMQQWHMKTHALRYVPIVSTASTVARMTYWR